MRLLLVGDGPLRPEMERRAADMGQTLSATIEAALREILEKDKKPKHAYRFRWKTVKGGVQPGVDLADRDALIDRMEGRS